LFGMDNVVCTPHLGASTTEAQVNVAIQVAEQMADYLTQGAVTNALNTPSISAEDAPRLKPYIALGEQLGSFSGQITGHAIEEIKINYEGTVTDLNTDPITSALICSLLGAQMDSVNMVNAMNIAEARGIKISQSYSDTGKNWRSMIDVYIKTDDRARNVTGTLFTGKEPRIVNIEGVPIEAAITDHMLFIRNDDTPGLVGSVGSILGNAGINIANFHLGRKDGEDEAICLVSLDAPLNDHVFAEIEALPQVTKAKRLDF
jgi:D-3-phosphoglycerate dehydrogenase